MDSSIMGIGILKDWKVRRKHENNFLSYSTSSPN